MGDGAAQCWTTFTLRPQRCDHTRRRVPVTAELVAPCNPCFLALSHDRKAWWKHVGSSLVLSGCRNWYRSCCDALAAQLFLLTCCSAVSDLLTEHASVSICCVSYNQSLQGLRPVLTEPLEKAVAVSGARELSMWCGGRIQQAHIIKTSQWLAEHLGLQVVVLSDAAALEYSVSAAEAPLDTPVEGGITTTPSSCESQPSNAQQNGPLSSGSRSEDVSQLNGNQAAYAIEQAPATAAVPAAQMVQKHDILVGAPADSEDDFLDDLLAGAPDAVAESATAVQPAARGLPPGHRPFAQLLSDSEDGDDFLDGLLDDQPPPVKSFESIRTPVSSQVSQFGPVGATAVTAAASRLQTTCLSSDLDSDQLLDDLLGSESSMEAGGLEFNADSRQDEARKHGTQVSRESPAKKHIPEGRLSNRTPSTAAFKQHPPAAIEQQVSAGAVGGGDNLLDSLMAEDVVFDKVSH